MQLTIDLPNFSSNNRVIAYGLNETRNGLHVMFLFEEGGLESTNIYLSDTIYKLDLIESYMFNFSSGNFTEKKCQRPVFENGNPYKIRTNIMSQFYSNMQVYNWKLAIHKKKIKVILSDNCGQYFKAFIDYKKTYYKNVEELFNYMKKEFLRGNFNLRS